MCFKNVQHYPRATKEKLSCADPESFVRVRPTLDLTTFLLRGEMTKIPSSARQRNAISMAFRWPADDGPTLNAGLVALKILRIAGDPVQNC